MRVIAWSVARALGSTAALVAIYYLLPLGHTSVWAAVMILVAGLALFAVLVAFHVRAVLSSQYPGLRAVEALATSVPLFVLLFAASYVVMAGLSAGSFTQPLTRTNALYFAVTVASTVGFGDITAKTMAAQLVVTAQMVCDIVIIGVAVKAITSAVKHRRGSSPARGGGEAGGTRAAGGQGSTP